MEGSQDQKQTNKIVSARRTDKASHACAARPVSVRARRAGWAETARGRVQRERVSCRRAGAVSASPKLPPSTLGFPLSSSVRADALAMRSDRTVHLHPAQLGVRQLRVEEIGERQVCAGQVGAR